MFENQKKKKYGNKRYFYINIHLKGRLDIEVELMPDEALTSFTVSDAYRQFAGQKVGHA